MPFFITNALNLIPISEYNFIRNYKEYKYRFEDIDTITLKLFFRPKDETENSRYPLSGYFTMNKHDFSISEVSYENEFPYTVKSMLLISINLGSSSLVSAFNKVEKLEVFLKFKRDENLDKYLLDSLHANSSFKDSTSIKDRTTYYKHHSSTSIKRKSEAFDECKNEEINLKDLGLYFKK